MKTVFTIETCDQGITITVKPGNSINEIPLWGTRGRTGEAEAFRYLAMHMLGVAGRNEFNPDKAGILHQIEVMKAENALLYME